MRLAVAGDGSPINPSGSYRVLLVDDAPFAFRFLSLLLEEAGLGHKLEWKNGFDVGLEALKATNFDVCLLDYQLGERSGLDFLRAAVAAGVRTPIVMLTGQGHRELDMDALAAGAADYLVKGEFSGAMLDRVMRYVIERRRVSDALRDSEQRYALAVEGANDGLWDWQVPEGRIYLSKRWKEVLGFAEEELPSAVASWFDRVHPEDLDSLQYELDRHTHGKTTHLEHEHRLRHKDGSWRYVLARGKGVMGPDGKCVRLAGSLTDVTTARNHDALTKLPNRVMFLDRLEYLFRRLRRDPDFGFAVLFIDLDRFKNVNDSLGHAAGDQLLVDIARRLEQCVRGVDIVARLGGDEFTVVLDAAREPDGAVRVAQRIIDELGQPFTVEGRQVFTGASIGIALASPTSDPFALLRDADTAMYRAKAEGKGRYAMFDAAMRERALKVLKVESGLRKAVEQQQLEVVYQPVVRVADRTLAGFEALVRWRDDDGKLISPGDFIPIAEETTLVALVDLYMLQAVCGQLGRWSTQGLLGEKRFVSVNVSRRHFAHVGFAAQVAAALAKHAVPFGHLKLEVTESVTTDAGPHAQAECEALAKLGVDLVVDDFGVGASSIASLQDYSFRGLKVDRSFTRHLDTGDKGKALVRATVELARALGLSETAEGVETAAQHDALHALGCEFAQGYLYARPLPVGDAEAWLRAGKAPSGR